tara:strand:- start:2010 stop:2315 length:306 start_codon:yes stop_codon:yes gene_type:complete
MTVKNIIDQIEQIFGRQPEKYMLQIINDALIEISGEARHYTRTSKTDLTSFQRWYELENKMIDIIKVEIKDTNDRYVRIPKLADPHKLLKDDTDETEGILT